MRSTSAPTRLSLLLLAPALAAAAFAAPPRQDAPSLEPDRWEALSWDELGPVRGGRSCAVTGVPGSRDTYYMGAAGGGVWRTDDGGASWRNVSDGAFGGSIGSVAVAPSDAQVVWVGTGEKTIRGNVSHGDGVWRSTDGGRTWSHAGLPDSRHVCRLRVHPKDPDTAWAAALGHLYGPNAERGVFKTTDGGATWRRVLHVSDEAGAVDLCVDPANPRILYASLWNVDRTPWGLNSGGPGSGLWKSTDGGETWDELSDNPGFATGTLGIIGVSVSPVDPDRVYAMVEAAEGGLFVSDDAGATWRRRNDEAKLRQRAWYYTRVVADPAHVDQVWVLNVRLWRSRDGGESFESVSTPHSDNHDLWIDPDDPRRMIESNDGGANVSTDGGATWSRQDNQPTAQLYRVSADDDFPYRVMGGQQDNSALRIRSRGRFGGRPGLRDWEPTAGGESGHVVAKPGEPDVVFGGSYGGYLTRLDHRTGELRRADVWPDNPMGWGTRELAYRFQWNFPLFYSPHEPHALYAAANVLFRTTDDGQSWTALSPDLTRDDETKQESSGGPITKDNTGVEYHATIFAALESPLVPGLLWCGSDDGLVHVSQDDGATWTDVTPIDLPKWAQVNSLDAHPSDPGGLYLAATAYKSDDFTPYLFRTRDFGATWTRIDAGIPRDHFTRALRADPDREGLLYAGTERGVYVSLDDGASWSSLQNDLPQVPVTDLLVKEGELVAATQGRGYWVLRDLAPLHTWQGLPDEAAFVLFPPRDAVRARGYGLDLSWYLAEDLPDGAARSLEVLGADGAVLHTIEGGRVGGEAGLNRLKWDLSLESAEGFDGMVLWNSSLSGPRIVPGAYTARLTLGDSLAEVPFTVVPDPRTDASQADLQAQFDFLVETRDLLTEVHTAITDLRAARADLAAVRGKLEALDAEAHATTIARASEVEAALTTIEEALYQTKSRSRQDPLNYPIRLNDKLAGVRGAVAMGDHAPTAQAVAVRAELEAAIREQLAAWETLVATDLPALDAAARDAGVPLVRVPEREAADGVD